MAASVETLSFPLLEVENLSKRFGDSAALTSISFSVREKEIVGVIGPNGSGKTTLLECIAGLLHPDSGLRHDCLAKPSNAPAPAEKILVLLTRWDFA
jgi:ABC-type multidrug transport system ATPase subunit